MNVLCKNAHLNEFNVIICGLKDANCPFQRYCRKDHNWQHSERASSCKDWSVKQH
jgi:hypothetical protein